MHWFRRFLRRDRPQIPDALWRDCVASLPFLQRLTAPELQRLRQLGETLLHQNTFTGAAGFELDDRVAVSIAAQAGLPILNLTPALYRDMAGVIVYPSQFIVPQSEIDDAGVLHEWHEPISGEAIEAGGAVILSWEDVEEQDAPGYNVVIHEFAHKIDMGDGHANGCPPFLPAFHAGLSAAGWRRAFAAAYDDFTRRVDALEAALPADFDEDEPEHAERYDALCAELPLDPYAASHPAEFFAVASEAFFVLPQALAAAYPEVYRLLAGYYRQDPLAGQPTAAAGDGGGKHL